MVCLGFEPEAAGWKVQMSYSGTPILIVWSNFNQSRRRSALELYFPQWGVFSGGINVVLPLEGQHFVEALT